MTGTPGRSPEARTGLDVVTRSFAERVSAQASLVAVWENGARSASVWSGWGLDEYGRPGLEQGEGLVGRLATSRSPVFGSALEIWTDPPQGRVDGRVTFAAASPVRTIDGTVGVLCAGLVRPPSLEPEPLLWTADCYAAVAALCISEGGNFRDLLLAGERDGLTGCLNYRGVMGALADEINRCRRYGGELSCCFVDLNQFKQINERGGHLEGNKVLASVGMALTYGVRSFDRVGRFGGDEFVLVLPETGVEAAVALAERLIEGLSEAVRRATGVQVTASAGVAGWSPGVTADDLIARSDRALLLAKTRSGVAVAPWETER